MLECTHLDCNQRLLNDFVDAQSVNINNFKFCRSFQGLELHHTILADADNLIWSVLFSL